MNIALKLTIVIKVKSVKELSILLKETFVMWGALFQGENVSLGPVYKVTLPLLATGLIVGESLFGVVNAAIIAASGGESPLEIFEGGTVSNVLGIIVFVVGIGFAYRWTKSKVTKS